MPRPTEVDADEQFVARAIEFAASHSLTTEPQSDEDYLIDLVAMAARARQRGDYGIAASVVMRSGGTEVVCPANNAVITQANPVAHAEIQALLLARAVLIAAAEGRSIHDVKPTCLVRPAPHAGREIVLYTSLEPCPQCAVAALVAGVSRIVIALPDPRGGALLWPHRLPARFAEDLANRAVIEVCQSDRRGPGYAAQELLTLLSEAYEPTQGRLAAATAGRGLFPVHLIAGAHRTEEAG